MKLRKNKKGSLQDVAFIAALILFAAITILIGFKVTSEFNSEIQSRADIDTLGKANVAELNSFYPGVIDNSFLLLTIGLAIVTFILAALVRISPIFLALYIIALVFVIFLAGILSNVYQGMAENTHLQAEADQLVFISNILEFLPLIVGTFGSILAIVMYKSWRDNSGV